MLVGILHLLLELAPATSSWSKYMLLEKLKLLPRLVENMQLPYQQIWLAGALILYSEEIQRESLEVTDDVSIVEHLKHPVYITEGCYTNIKENTRALKLDALENLASEEGEEALYDHETKRTMY